MIGPGWPTLNLDSVPEDAVLLDVRPPELYADGHAPNAVNIPVDELPERLGEVPRPAGTLPVTCEGGQEGKIATRLLSAEGLDVAELVGGMDAWRRSGRRLIF